MCHFGSAWWVVRGGSVGERERLSDPRESRPAMGLGGFPDGSVVKNPPANAGDTGLIPELGRSPRVGNGNPLQCSCLGNPRKSTVHGVTELDPASLGVGDGQGGLACCDSWGRKESDTTERLN